jgi:hypothetical protein
MFPPCESQVGSMNGEAAAGVIWWSCPPTWNCVFVLFTQAARAVGGKADETTNRKQTDTPKLRARVLLIHLPPWLGDAQHSQLQGDAGTPPRTPLS